MSSGDQQSADADPLPCPRCNSRDTKFCYYNNYSTAQPRHFCKNCKRYWTAGGSLRNVPVGGGLRKSKKSKLSKHARDLLSASAEEFSASPGKQATSLLLASPSSSADGAIDEAFANPVVPLLAYRPTFDFATESLVPGDCMSLAPSHPFDYSALTQNCEENGNGLLPANGITYQHAQAVRDGGFLQHQPQDWYGSVDQAHCNYGEISSGLSTAPPNMHSSRYSTPQRHPEHERREFKMQTVLRQSSDESRISNEQGNVQRFVKDHTLSHDGNLQGNNSPPEDEDEGLGNVINVRYPYEWEQVSEVLFGGTPDFFQMPTF